MPRWPHYAAILIFIYVGADRVSASNLTAPRFILPVLCTENPAARTKVRGTAVVLDARGTIVTAAHVVVETHPSCVLTALVPNDEWSRALSFHAFSVGDCSVDASLDVALCRLRPIENTADWSYLRAAAMEMTTPLPNSSVSIVGFTGWGMLPIMASGRIAPPARIYRRQDGCYCDFAVDVITHAGMSGSPILTIDGKVAGVVTTAGTGKFRGITFGTTFERAAAFLHEAGLASVASHTTDHH